MLPVIRLTPWSASRSCIHLSPLAGPSVSTKPSPSPAGPSASTSKGTTNGTSSSKPAVLDRKDSTISTASSSTPAPLPAGTVRSSKTDSVDTSKITDDKMRNKCIELIYDSLSMDSAVGEHRFSGSDMRYVSLTNISPHHQQHLSSSWNEVKTLKQRPTKDFQIRQRIEARCVLCI